MTFLKRLFGLVITVFAATAMQSGASAVTVFHMTSDSYSVEDGFALDGTVYAADTGTFSFYVNPAYTGTQYAVVNQNTYYLGGSKQVLTQNNGGAGPSGIQMSMIPTGYLAGHAFFAMDFWMDEPAGTAGMYHSLLLNDTSGAQVGMVAFNRNGTLGVYDSSGVAYVGPAPAGTNLHLEAEMDFSSEQYRVQVRMFGGGGIIADSGWVGFRTPGAIELSRVVSNPAFWHWQNVRVFMDNMVINDTDSISPAQGPALPFEATFDTDAMDPNTGPAPVGLSDGNYAAEEGSIGVGINTTSGNNFAELAGYVDNATRALHLGNYDGGDASGANASWWPGGYIAGVLRFSADFKFHSPDTTSSLAQTIILYTLRGQNIATLEMGRDGTIYARYNDGIETTSVGTYAKGLPDSVYIDVDFDNLLYRAVVPDVGQYSFDSGWVALNDSSITADDAFGHVLFSPIWWHWQDCNLWIDNLKVQVHPGGAEPNDAPVPFDDPPSVTPGSFVEDFNDGAEGWVVASGDFGWVYADSPPDNFALQTRNNPFKALRDGGSNNGTLQGLVTMVAPDGEMRTGLVVRATTEGDFGSDYPWGAGFWQSGPAKFFGLMLENIRMSPSILFNYQAGKSYWIKIHCHGGLTQAKAWEDGTSEPEEWMLQADWTYDMNLNGNETYVGVYQRWGYPNNTTRWDDITWTVDQVVCDDVATKNIADLNEDCDVNLVDLIVFANQWLDCMDPAGCP